jgi:hypothetical protein
MYSVPQFSTKQIFHSRNPREMLGEEGQNDGTGRASTVLPPADEATMNMIFDIFLRLPDGKPLWVEAVDGFEKAKVHVEELVQASPGDYFIFDSKTGRILQAS